MTISRSGLVCDMNGRQESQWTKTSLGILCKLNVDTEHGEEVADASPGEEDSASLAYSDDFPDAPLIILSIHYSTKNKQNSMNRKFFSQTTAITILPEMFALIARKLNIKVK